MNTGSDSSVADFGRVSADNEAFAGWVDKMKGRFRTAPAPVRPLGKTEPHHLAAELAAARLTGRLDRALRGHRLDFFCVLSAAANAGMAPVPVLTTTAQAYIE